MKDEELLDCLKRLRTHNDFIVWRDSVAKPLISQLENELNKSDEMPEVILRANLKYLNTLKALFYTWFDSI